jgi:hypothetical protein
MRTTLDLDEDILHAAKALARQRGTSMGAVVSDLARTALEPKAGRVMRNGFEVFVPRPGARKPSLEFINRLRDEE